MARLSQLNKRTVAYEKAALEKPEPLLRRTYLVLTVAMWVTVIAGGLDWFPQGSMSGSAFRLGEDTSTVIILVAAIVGAAAQGLLAILLGQEWGVSPNQNYMFLGLTLVMAVVTIPLLLAAILRMLAWIIVIAIVAGVALALYHRFTGRLPFIDRQQRPRPWDP